MPTDAAAAPATSASLSSISFVSASSALASLRTPIEVMTPTCSRPFNFGSAARSASSTDGSGFGSSPKRA